jgi:hypothetical protein
MAGWHSVPRTLAVAIPLTMIASACAVGSSPTKVTHTPPAAASSPQSSRSSSATSKSPSYAPPCLPASVFTPDLGTADAAVAESQGSFQQFGVTFHIPAGVTVSKAVLSVYPGSSAGGPSTATGSPTVNSATSSKSLTSVVQGEDFTIDPEHPGTGETAAGLGTYSVWISATIEYQDCSAGLQSSTITTRLATVTYT